MTVPSSRTPSAAGANVSQTKLPKVSDVMSNHELGASSQCSAQNALKYPAEATDADSALLALGKQFDEIAGEIQRLYNSGSAESHLEQIEAMLGRLQPVETAIMAMPAHTIGGLGVKARHAAYVMSEYWSGPTDRIDWDARAMRRLIEAVCESAGVPLPLHGAPDVGSGTPTVSPAHGCKTNTAACIRPAGPLA